MGGDWYWNWKVLDAKTLYLLASHLSKGRGTADAIRVKEKAIKEAAGKLPKTATTDQLGSYVPVIGTVMPGTRHILSQGIYEEVNNNLSERMQDTFRDRTKTLRGLQGRASGQRYRTASCWTTTCSASTKCWAGKLLGRLLTSGHRIRSGPT